MTTQRRAGTPDPGGICASPDMVIRDAMALMTENRHGLLPVVDGQGVLIGIVVDGDIRRGMLKGADLDGPIAQVVNPRPVIATQGMEEHEIHHLLRATSKVCAPVVDGQGRLVRLAALDRHPIANCVPSVEGRELAYVAEALKDGWLAVGPFLRRFEEGVARVTGARHAVAMSNGTAALHLSLKMAGVGPGDRVLVPALTFIATANAVAHCGAVPILFDSEPVSWGMSPDQVARYLERETTARDGVLVDRRDGGRIAAIMPVHLYGHPADMEPLVALAEQYEVPLVEDGAEALGARYRGRLVGSLHRLCALSFNGNKVITAGGGGMILTDDAETAHRARYLAGQAKLDGGDFQHGDVGYNYRMPNLNAALALAQLEQLDTFLARKRGFVARYAELLEGLAGVGIWRGADWAENSHWMAILTVDPDRHPDAIERLRRFLPARGIEARSVWPPLDLQAPYAGAPSMPLEVAHRIHRSALCLPCSNGLSPEDLQTVARALLEYFTLNP